MDLEKCQPTTVVSDDSFNDYSFDLDCSSDIIANDNDRIVVVENNLSIFDDKNPLPQDTSHNFSTLLTEKNQQTTRNKPPVQSTPLPDIQRRQRQIFNNDNNKVTKRLSSPELLIDTDQPIIEKPLLNESNFDDDDIEFDDIITEHHSPENVITIEQSSNNDDNHSLIEHQTLRISCPKSSLLLSNNNDLEKCQPTTVVSDDSFNDYSFDLDCSSDIIANDNDRIVVGKNNLSIFDDKNPLPQDTSDNFSTLLTEKNQQIKRNKPPVQSTPLPDIQRRRQIFNKVAYRLSSPDLLVDTDQPIIKKPNESNFDDDIEFDEIITEHHSPENVITIEQSSNNQSLIEHQTLRISCPKSSLLLSDNNGYKLLSLEQIIAQFE
ncbi:hypothetical protein DERP_002505 [Dermatophagoides pteronyssinus]|uniref:Uncharacterized protein n=1 Tax=Dermatophagoides pteronyssinus TaxID=6956 RepID=A0ABQ8JHW6_DERPT|nr:hypothetical protein DERP_002505 [Dermatophagoides pteronyssinus]